MIYVRFVQINPNYFLNKFSPFLQRFTLNDLCDDTELVFSKDGFLSFTIMATDATGIIRMHRIGENVNGYLK